MIDENGSGVFMMPPALSDEAAYEVCQFLNCFVRMLENYYAAQLKNHHHEMNQLNEQMRLSEQDEDEELYF